MAVLANDPVFDDAGDLNDLPVNMIDRLDHYFKTYKAATSGADRVEIEARYGVSDAYEVVEAAIADYGDKFEASTSQERSQLWGAASSPRRREAGSYPAASFDSIHSPVASISHS